MKVLQLRSLQARLALQLAALYVAATAIAVAALIYQAYDTADTLNDRELSLRAGDLARYITIDLSGAARLELPPELAARYHAAGNADILQFAPARMPLLWLLPRTSQRSQQNGRWGRTTRAIFVSRISAPRADSTMA